VVADTDHMANNRRRQAAWKFLSLALVANACGGGPETAPSPTTSATPGPAPTPTRVISLDGNLTFGIVTVGSTKDATFKINNSGTATLTVNGLSVTSGLGSVYTVSWTGGIVVAGGSQTVNVHFTPTATQTYNGTITVNADHTSGTNTIAISGTGAAATSGSGGTSRVLLFGGRNHGVFLGCYSCNRLDSDSVFNEFGSYGSRFSSTSIWNHFSDYGSKFSSDSACNEFASNPPVLVDESGKFYGALTVNRFAWGAITDSTVVSWLRNAVCEL
jgi:HYDIN/CFA65/VesB family protein